MELNGKNYEVMYLDDEEKIVIDALRAGAKVEVTFHRATIEQAIANTNQMPRNALSRRHIVDLTEEKHSSYKPSFIYVEAKNEEGNVSLNHIIDVKRKATDGNQ